jgi:serine/threonine-protein kinase RsbW
VTGDNGYAMESLSEGRAALRFESGKGVVSAVLRDVAAYLTRRGLPPGKVEDATIALAEALNNIEEHAYAGRSGLPVLVEIKACARRLRFRIEDRGTPLPGETLPGGSLPATDPVAHEKWPEGGFGWALLRRLTSDLTYHRRGDWNQLCFTIS